MSERSLGAGWLQKAFYSWFCCRPPLRQQVLKMVVVVVAMDVSLPATCGILSPLSSVKSVPGRWCFRA